jgi:iron complex outermembrane receptor protein
VSLRGTGASGASRAVVLSDGVPLNDPFGGWVTWGRVPRASISRVEVLRGGASSLYGSDALGGVINIITREPTSRTLSFEASYGNQQTPNATLFAGGQKGRWRASLSSEVLSTDRYILVAESERGRVDTPAGSRHSAFDLKLERELGKGATVFARASYFGEARTNGLIPQVARHQLTFQTRYTNPKLMMVGLQGRLMSAQFDDDQNRLPLNRAFTLDAFVSRQMTHDVELFLAAENLLNQRYQIGRTPVTALGSPSLVRMGLRLNLGAR